MSSILHTVAVTEVQEPVVEVLVLGSVLGEVSGSSVPDDPEPSDVSSSTTGGGQLILMNKIWIQGRWNDGRLNVEI